MATPSFSPDQVAQVVELVAGYISERREEYSLRAAPLSSQLRSILRPFFSPKVLESTRALVLRRERVPNPEFYPMLRSLGFEDLPDQSAAAAITFYDVIVCHEPFSDGLLFHELVHVEQYRQFGIRGFAERYVRGFLSGGSYEAIPLEVNAYALEDHFRGDPLRVFSVEQEVARWAAEGKLG